MKKIIKKDYIVTYKLLSDKVYKEVSDKDYSIDEFKSRFHTNCSILNIERVILSEDISFISILDDKEKEYLSNIINPFRHRVLSICKVFCLPHYYISINLLDDDDIYLPFFDRTSDMYKGMEADKDYTLEELGL